MECNSQVDSDLLAHEGSETVIWEKYFILHVRITGIRVSPRYIDFKISHIPPQGVAEVPGRIVWEQAGEPAQTSSQKLLASVKEVAAAVILARYWPGSRSKQQHDTYLCLAGGLARMEWADAKVVRFLAPLFSEISYGSCEPMRDSCGLFSRGSPGDT